MLPTVAVTMDFYKDGKGVAFGKVAETSGLLDVAWDIKSSGIMKTPEYSKLTGFNYLGIADLNTIKTPGMYGVYNSTNAPTNDIATLEVVMYSPDWIIQRFTVVGSGTVYIRSWYGGTTWSAWNSILDHSKIKDYIIEQGKSGDWEYTKWENGKIELFAEQNLSFPAGTKQADNLYRSIVSLNMSSFVTKILSGTCGVQINGMVPLICRHSVSLSVAEVVIVTSRTFAAFDLPSAPVYIIGKWK